MSAPARGERKSLLSVPRSVLLFMIGTLLVVSFVSLWMSIREDLALREIRQHQPEIISLHTASFFPGFRGFLLLAVAWGVYRRTFSSWIWSSGALMVALWFHQLAYVCRVLTWGSAVSATL